jgi:hypothetical protein
LRELGVLWIFAFLAFWAVNQEILFTAKDAKESAGRVASLVCHSYE